MPVISCSRSTMTPRSQRGLHQEDALRSRDRAAGHQLLGVDARERRDLGAEARRSGVEPGYPVSSDRRHFCSDSGNVRPIAMTSPTDCIIVLEHR